MNTVETLGGKMLTVGAAARFVGVTPATIWNWTRWEYLTVALTLGKCRLFYEKDIELASKNVQDEYGRGRPRTGKKDASA